MRSTELTFPRLVILLIMLCGLATGVAEWSHSAPRRAPKTDTAHVESLHDADTARVRVSRQSVTVRLFSVDAPEMERRGYWLEQPRAAEARDAASKLIAGKKVTLTYRGMSYARRVAAIEVEGKDLATELVKQGWAWVDPRYNRDPELDRLQAEAREAKRGLWQEPDPIPPWSWRRNSTPARRD
jgi:micrococcal nuclease